MNTAEVRYLKIRFDDVLKRLHSYARRKAKERNVRTIVLVGSLAKGTYTGTSDADILIIADDLPSNILDRHTIFSDNRMPIDLEPHVYTAEEFLNLLRLGDRFILDTLRFGIPLYGKRFFNQLKTSNL
ncbi:nucleotidyltransferase domain-containing protein [Candidatus Bathyarchaeota archaeon]|nr:nucleotidyltransferase domain-containing protein [Candidatus Bathyarchaeota archaeon]MBS7629432.1 nucleotidyltransferase domain-containing protein [Candidatus Bathyarchaeota archaeon]